MSVKRVIILAVACFAIGSVACAGPSARNVSAAVDHSALAAAYGSGALVKGVASVVSVPLLAVGSAGVAVGVSWAAMAEFASSPLPLGSEPEHDSVIANDTPDPATAMRKGD